MMLQLYLKLIKKPKTSLIKVSIKLQAKTNQKVSFSSIKKLLNDYNVRAFIPIKKPLLSKKNILARFEKSRQFLLLSDNKIKKIIFSSESKFKLFWSDGKVSVWREADAGLKTANLSDTVKHGGGQ